MISKDKLEAAIDFSSDGVLISDNQANIIYVNKAYEDTTGLKKKDILNRNLKDLLDEGFFNQSVTLLVLESKESISIIHKYISGKTALTTGNPIYDEDKNIMGVICNTRNITDLINLKTELNTSKELTEKYSQEVKMLREIANKHQDFIYKSKIMEETVKLALKVASYDTTVLITGESGTGKEVLAKFIHHESPRKDEAFIKVNCAAIPKNLFESELFGYEEGSFTGASKEGKPGMFELANEGTILLDEIGELPLEVQSKLLRVIQEREVFRIGAEKPTPIDVRILAATNRNLLEEIEEGNFREDLFFRLNVIPINIPPLRERPEDVAEFIEFFLGNLNKKYKKIICIKDEAVDLLTSYSWPGNVRELENLIEYLFIMTTTDEIDVEQLPTRIITEQIANKFQDELEDGSSKLKYMTDLYEKTIIEGTLKNYTSIRQTAKALGIHYSTLSRKIEKFGINFEEIQGNTG